VRALRWDGARLALALDAPDPRPGAGEALVRVHLAGICRTDLEITRGYLGFRGTPGHEWVGDVLAADDPALVGRRVVGEINLACGAGAEVSVAGPHETKLARARGLGIRTGPPPPGADLVVDASGAPDGLALALALVRPRGTVLLKTTVAAEHRLDLAPAVINEVTILGSRCGRFPPALAALAARRVAAAPLIAAV